MINVKDWNSELTSHCFPGTGRCGFHELISSMSDGENRPLLRSDSSTSSNYQNEVTNFGKLVYYST